MFLSKSRADCSQGHVPVIRDADFSRAIVTYFREQLQLVFVFQLIAIHECMNILQAFYRTRTLQIIIKKNLRLLNLLNITKKKKNVLIIGQVQFRM